MAVRKVFFCLCAKKTYQPRSQATFLLYFVHTNEASESNWRTNKRAFFGRHLCIQSIECFSLDVTAAILVSLNKGTAAILVSPTNPPGIELFYHANVFFCFGGKTRLLIT